MVADTKELRRISDAVWESHGSIDGSTVADAADEIDALRARAEKAEAELDMVRNTVAETCAELACDNDNEAILMAIHALRAENARLRERLSMAREFVVGSLRVVWRSEGKWVVEDPMRELRNRVLNRDGRWVYDQGGTSILFPLEEALDVACALVEREAKTCKSCCGSGVRDDVRWGGIADTTPCDQCNRTGVAESAASVEKCECGGKGA